MSVKPKAYWKWHLLNNRLTIQTVFDLSLRRNQQMVSAIKSCRLQMLTFLLEPRLWSRERWYILIWINRTQLCGLRNQSVWRDSRLLVDWWSSIRAGISERLANHLGQGRSSYVDYGGMLGSWFSLAGYGCPDGATGWAATKIYRQDNRGSASQSDPHSKTWTGSTTNSVLGHIIWRRNGSRSNRLCSTPHKYRRWETRPPATEENPEVHNQVIDEHIDRMVQHGLVQPAREDWGFEYCVESKERQLFGGFA